MRTYLGALFNSTIEEALGTTAEHVVFTAIHWLSVQSLQRDVSESNQAT